MHQMQPPAGKSGADGKGFGGGGRAPPQSHPGHPPLPMSLTGPSKPITVSGSMGKTKFPFVKKASGVKWTPEEVRRARH